MSRASSEYTGFGMAAGHKYILEYFDEDAKDTVRGRGVINHVDTVGRGLEAGPRGGIPEVDPKWIGS